MKRSFCFGSRKFDKFNRKPISSCSKFISVPKMEWKRFRSVHRRKHLFTPRINDIIENNNFFEPWKGGFRQFCKTLVARNGSHDEPMSCGMGRIDLFSFISQTQRIYTRIMFMIQQRSRRIVSFDSKWMDGWVVISCIQWTSTNVPTQT